jgi:hypothetical protein
MVHHILKLSGDKVMKNVFLCGVFVVLLSACGSVHVTTEVDNAVDFSVLASYDWLQTDKSPGDDVRVNNPEIAALVRAAVEKRLLSMGYIKNENGEADFLITWFGAIEQKVKVQSIDHFYTSYGYGALVSSMPLKSKNGAKVRQYEEGTIIVDALIPGSHKVYWRGVGTDRLLKDMDKKDVKLYIDRIVGQILKDFPTRKK